MGAAMSMFMFLRARDGKSVMLQYLEPCMHTQRLVFQQHLARPRGAQRELPSQIPQGRMWLLNKLCRWAVLAVSLDFHLLLFVRCVRSSEECLRFVQTNR